MSKIVKGIFASALLFCLLFSIGVPCVAEKVEGKISVIVEDENKKAINNLEISICKIAQISEGGYQPTEPFMESGISVSSVIKKPNATNAKAVYDYIIKNKISATNVKTKNGRADFENLQMGIWLVFGKENGSYRFAPYFVFLPYEQNGKLYHQVNSTPKLEKNKPNNQSIYVLKKWEDKNNAAKHRPKNVEIILLRNGKQFDSIKLNEECGWSHTFRELPMGDYSVEETPVKNYSSKVSGDNRNGFIITNTYSGGKLPQTGQLWWPIAVLCVAGGLFVVLGILDIGARKNGKK